ncbi:MAG: virulence factor [Candidatus Pristimantibacillus lignocellulolyticus]|uniref:Virulence factor n=1 Tax=Candidatus Pristimantibacillus lignocellulolyticus TaxID=2994561 RepID=A0A9J6ZGM0_9BACL|nr:MAG: virulence factor [Candidatus Pristimantibacillus lignocellulolyticus]
MKLLSIEPTPSPNSMKLNLDESLPRGRRLTYSTKEANELSEPYRSLLMIKGVRSLFHTVDFIALDRKPGADWAAILAEARNILQAEQDLGAAIAQGSTGFGEAQVLVQMFRGIPIQVRVRTVDGEVRSAVPQKFMDAVTEAAGSSMIRERKLEEFGVRYGAPEDIATEIVQELEASYTSERLQSLIEASLAIGSGDDTPIEVVRPLPLTGVEVLEQLLEEEWQVRYAAFERYVIDEDAVEVLQKALADSNASIRRHAVILLGDLKTEEAMSLLYKALADSSPSVRRTAGDTLSDLGDVGAIEPMIVALADKNKLVRWRAARFLYEVGDERALDALQVAANDPEFEIQLQAKIAIERIERGEEAAGSVWQQMTAARQKEQQ